ncbi:hypothetical protein ASD15_30900 [Massilia sp. Root351]|jgi:hypothetical protein|uniref:hypothetical protein n=1 Tax=Massilia sp. Root351 TaxID=1736522 RepID=UPI00070F2502|nr:hypothetical protein [Massilia sp. Root351]KQV83894.1 hypothetical protein ASD15_30900 [Massilia sp. Root351]
MMKTNGGWLISAGSVGKGKKGVGVSIGSASRNTAACWQLHPAAGALPAAQAKLVWHGVFAALVGDV